MKSSKYNILIADDDFLLLQSLKILVERLGHTVVCTAETEAEVLQWVKSNSIDLALLDIGMQESDGIVTAGGFRGTGADRAKLPRSHWQ